MWKDHVGPKGFVGEECDVPHIDPVQVELVVAWMIKQYRLVE